MAYSGWVDFWSLEKNGFDEVMKVATDHFSSEIETRFQIDKNQQILDYGCGPGFLVHYFRERGISVTGADINPFYVDVCRKKFPDSRFIQLSSLMVDNVSIVAKELADDHYDFIILLSIVQYLKDKEELTALIQILAPHLKDEGKIILGDVLDEKTSPALDALSSLKQCARSGKILSFIRFIGYLIFSRYRTFSTRFNYLKVTESMMEDMARKNGLRYSKIEGLSIHQTRTNYVIYR